MNKLNQLAIRIYWLALLLLAIPTSVFADNGPVPSPLGFPIGSTAIEKVRKELSGKTELRNVGANHYTRGPMLDTDGAYLGMSRLKRVRFIFDKKKNLVATLMIFHTGGFNSTFAHLAAKYPLVSKKVPFVGSKSARFRKGNVVIVLDAPHLSFEMTIIYMTRGFEKLYAATSKSDTKREKQQERSNF